VRGGPPNPTRPAAPCAGAACWAVRPAQRGELALLPAIERSADVRFADLGFDLVPGAAAVAALRASLAVRVAGRPPVGFAQVVELDGLAHLEELAVVPAFGRRGLGRALLEDACRWSRDAGYRAMTLVTFRDVPWNAPFYRRAGFRLVRRLSPGLAALRALDRAHGLDALGPRVVMRRELGVRRDPGR
jgi:GNAT superfamily N-acetyltransferase